MSDSARPDSAAFRELEQLVRHLGDELAAFRRRALLAEARVRELEGGEASPVLEEQRDMGERVSRLEQENAALHGRLESALTRTRVVLDRVRFIRQQAQGSDR